MHKLEYESSKKMQYQLGFIGFSAVADNVEFVGVNHMQAEGCDVCQLVNVPACLQQVYNTKIV